MVLTPPVAHWRCHAWQALACDEVDGKLAAVRQLAQALSGDASTGLHGLHGLQDPVGPEVPTTLEQPGRPVRPALVDPRAVPKRSIGTPAGRVLLMHAVAHIEFNAINLALDACWRFGGMPAAYYADWARVATEEAMHFELVRGYLRQQGGDYGDHPAHDGLWQMCQATQHDVLARMALVPRLLEARGLDVTPGMQHKLAQAGDAAAVDVLAVILRDEVGHVAIGNHWYHWLCKERQLDPVATMMRLMQVHRAPRVKAPLNLDARQRAGFTSAELDALLAPAIAVNTRSSAPG